MFGGKTSKKVPKARKAKKAARTTRQSSCPAPVRRKRTDDELASARRTRGFIIGTVAFATVGLGSTVGLDWLDARAERMLDTREVKVAITWAEWLPPSSQAEIRALVLGALDAVVAEPDEPGDPVAQLRGSSTGSATGATTSAGSASYEPRYTVEGSLNTAPLRRVSRTLADSGWFERSPQVERGAEGAISVVGDWRTPAVWVRHNGLDRVVDWQGRPMPYAEPSGNLTERSLPLVLGVGRGPVRSGSSGQPLWNELWAPEDIGEALSLLRLLYERELIAQVRAIDLSRLGRLKEVSIVTDRGSVIVWGAPPGLWRPEDTRTTEDKLTVLSDHLARTGRIDANERVVEIYGPYTVANDAP